MLLKAALKLRFWNRSPLSLKACCVIDCHLSPDSRRASWQLSAKASDLHVFFWHLTNGNSLQICINSLCLTNNQGLCSVDTGNISSDTKRGWGWEVATESKSANNGCFNEGMNVAFWFRGKSFEVIFVFQQASANGAKSVCQGLPLQPEVMLPEPYKCWFVIGCFHTANTISNALCFRAKKLLKGLCLTTRGFLQCHMIQLELPQPYCWWRERKSTN